MATALDNARRVTSYPDVMIADPVQRALFWRDRFDDLAVLSGDAVLTETAPSSQGARGARSVFGKLIAMTEQPNEHRFAAREGVTTLYKFRPCRTEEHRRWGRDILVDHKVYFSRASQLNDPRDLRPRLRVRRGANDAETRRILHADAERVWARHKPPYSRDELRGKRLRLAREDIDLIELEALCRTHKRLDDEYWVFSLATSRDWVHMWHLYADEARGLAIHFRSDAHSPFGFAQRVIYQVEPPELLVPFGDLSERDVADISTLTKTSNWEGEEEYRWVRYPDADFSDIGLRFEGQHAHFPPQVLSGVTVGLQMPEADVRTILEIAAAHDPPLQVFRPRP